MLQTVLQYSHTLLREVVTSGDSVIDATVGNGHDTAFLAELVGPNGHVFGFDIQMQAIIATKAKINALSLDTQVHLHPIGHELLDTAIPEQHKIQAAIFNLGYLPKSDKQIITQPETTEQALDLLLPRLETLGRIILVVYYGHSGGQKELDFVESYCQQLPQELFSVLRYQFSNQRNNPPILFCIEKK